MHQLVGVFPQLAYLFLTSMSGSRMYVLIIPILEGVSCETEYNNVWKSKLRLAPATGEEPNAERTWRGATRALSWITNIEQSLKMTETKHFFTNICHLKWFFCRGFNPLLEQVFYGSTGKCGRVQLHMLSGGKKFLVSAAIELFFFSFFRKASSEFQHPEWKRMLRMVWWSSHRNTSRFSALENIRH